MEPVAPSENRAESNRSALGAPPKKQKQQESDATRMGVPARLLLRREVVLK